MNLRPNETQLLALIALAVVLPPVAVAIATRKVGMTLLSILLSFFFYIPGVIFAVWIVLKED